MVFGKLRRGGNHELWRAGEKIPSTRFPKRGRWISGVIDPQVFTILRRNSSGEVSLALAIHFSFMWPEGRNLMALRLRILKVIKPSVSSEDVS